MYSVGMDDFAREEMLAKITAVEHVTSIHKRFRSPSRVGTFELIKLYESPARWSATKMDLR